MVKENPTPGADAARARVESGKGQVCNRANCNPASFNLEMLIAFCLLPICLLLFATYSTFPTAAR